jgi:hypothetical protein
MKQNERPSTWICKSSNDGNSLAVSYASLIRNRVAGFSLVDIDPSQYSDLESLRENIVVRNKKAGFLTGKTFGTQAWNIGMVAKPGDRIFLECPGAGKKPKGKHRTFIVAAGVITGPFKYAPKKWDSIGILSVGVDWKWQGKELIDYGHTMYCFVGINESNPANVTLLKNLDRIYGAYPTDHATDTDATSVPEASSSMEFDPEWREGDAKMRHHLSIERCSKAANTAKDIARSRTGFIHCEACNVSTAKLYGYELIDAHHVIPLADTKGMSRKPSAGDFAMLCPTCHRAVHRELSSGAIGKEAIAKVKAKIK